MNGIAKIKLFRYRRVYIRICRLLIISWQGQQDVNQTIDEGFEKINVEELRNLLKEGEQ
jgi:hypothetical protein